MCLALARMSVVAKCMSVRTRVVEVGVPAVDGYRLSVLDASSPRARREAVLLLHGRTWSSGPVWVETGVMDGVLGERDHYAMDFRGFGRTPDRGVDSLLRPSTCAVDARRVVDYLREDRGYETVAVLGWSYGALVAQLVAQDADKLVLYASVWDERGDYADDFGSWTCDERGCYDRTPRGPQTFESCMSDFTIPGSISETRARAFARAALDADPTCVDWTALSEFKVDLGAITVPTLVVHGDSDPDAPTAEQRALFRALGAQHKVIRTIETADHVAHVLDSSRDAWAAAVRTFLDEC